MHTAIMIFFMVLALVFVGVIADSKNHQDVRVGAMYITGFLCALLTAISILG